MQNIDPIYPCPSCGFLVFDEQPGSYDICPLCNWEDDHVQLSFPTMQGGANGGSLYEYQQEALKRYPVKNSRVDVFVRDPEWRPLDASDLIVRADQPETGLQYFHAAAEDLPKYYWKIHSNKIT